MSSYASAATHQDVTATLRGISQSGSITIPLYAAGSPPPVRPHRVSGNSHQRRTQRRARIRALLRWLSTRLGRP